jgi:hypothetical protein
MSAVFVCLCEVVFVFAFGIELLGVCWCMFMVFACGVCL